MGSLGGYRKEDPLIGKRGVSYRRVDGQRKWFSWRTVTYYCETHLCGGFWRQREYSHLPSARFGVCSECAAKAWAAEQRGYLH